MLLSFVCEVCGRIGKEVPSKRKHVGHEKKWVQLVKETMGTHIPSTHHIAAAVPRELQLCHFQ